MSLIPVAPITRGHSRPLFLAGLVSLSLVTAASGITNGTDLSDATRPEVGLVHSRDGTNHVAGTGTLIQSNIVPARSFVLTAAHNVRNRTERGFIPRGGTAGLENKINASSVVIHPDFLDTADPDRATNDLAILRLSSIPSGITPAELHRNPVAVNNTLSLVGLGDPQNVEDYPKKFQKRQGDFKITDIRAGGTRLLATTRAADRLPTSEVGDSGGPWFETADFRIAGVHRGGSGFGQGAGGNDVSHATAVHPYLDWIDSHTRKAIFWDRLEIDRTVVDEFADYPAAGDRGIADGWQRAAVKHPTLGDIAADHNDWRYIHAIGFNARTTQVANQHAQGEIMQGERATVVRRAFTVSANQEIEINISQRWNSLGLGTDLGVQFGDGEIVWQGFWRSHLTDQTRWLDNWLDRSLRRNSGDATQVTIYLLNTVPDPATALLTAMALLLAVVRRPGSGHLGS